MSVLRTTMLVVLAISFGYLVLFFLVDVSIAHGL